MRTVARLAPLVFLSALFDCTTFAPLPANACGNGVVDVGEDCDTFARGATACRAPTTQIGACRLDCASTPCPSGFGCGTDNICREASGRFVRSANVIAAGVWRIEAGDFDGDRRKDLLTREPLDPGAQSKMRIHYFDSTATLAKTLIIPPALASPTVIDVNADKRADLVFSALGTNANLGGIGMMLGQADRTLTPVAFPTFSFPGTARLFPFHGLPGGSPTSFMFYTRDTKAAALGYVDPAGTLIVLTGLPMSSDPSNSNIGVGRLFEDPVTFPCEEAVLALPKTSEVLVYPICKRSGGAVVVNDTGLTDIGHVQLPAGLTVDHGILIADANSDGHLDILIGVVTGTPAVLKTFIAYGTGARGFKSDPNGAIDNKAAILRLQVTNMEDVEPALPLAVGDMNRDGSADFVTPTQILSSTRGPQADGGADGGSGALTYFVAGEKSRGTWTEAAIADFNGNGLADVIAGSNATLDLDFFNGNGRGSFSTFTLTTNGPVSSFSVADMDGDYLPDLAFAAGASAGDQLSIAYGRVAGPPETPVTVGAFQKIVQTVAFDPGAPVANIIVVDHPIDTKIALTSVSVLAGTGDRDPLALFSLTRPKVTTGVPYAAVPGAFSKAGNVDVFAVGDDLDLVKGTPTQTYRAWLAKATAPPSPTVTPQFLQAADGPKLGADAVPVINTDALFGISLLLAQGDLDGDGTPEIVIVTPRSQIADGTNTQITIAKPRTDAMAFDLGNPIALGVRASTSGQLAVADVDRDGALDIVLLTGPDDAFVLMVYLNDGHGGFDSARSVMINLKEEAPTGFALVDVGASEPPALAYVTQHAVVLAHIDAAAHNVARRETIDTPRLATGIVSADVDGDGVDDLAIADSNNLVILRAQAVLP